MILQDKTQDSTKAFLEQILEECPYTIEQYHTLCSYGLMNVINYLGTPGQPGIMTGKMDEGPSLVRPIGRTAVTKAPLLQKGKPGGTDGLGRVPASSRQSRWRPNWSYRPQASGRIRSTGTGDWLSTPEATLPSISFLRPV